VGVISGPGPPPGVRVRRTPPQVSR
jgi:hypothetical protein